MGMSPVGTSMRTSEKALDPESSVRVLIAIDARSDSTGDPSSVWYERGGLGGDGHERRVQRAAELARRRTGLGERCARDLQVAPQRALGPQRRACLLGIAELVDDAAERVGGSGTGVGDLARIGQEILDLPDDPERNAQCAGDEVAHRIGLALIDGLVGEVDLVLGRDRQIGDISFEVEELERQLDAALAVGDRVVQLLDQRGPVALRALRR